MAVPLFQPQAWYFYSMGWTQEIDTKFISLLEGQAKLGNLVIPDSTENVVRMAREEINNTFGTNFSVYFCRERLRKLSQRYMVFKKITSYSGVGWDRDTNTVLAPPDLWVKWLKDMTLTKAYIYQGEPSWDALEAIFGKKMERRVPVNDEVIEISSDEDNPTGGHNGLRVDNANMVVAEDDEDEVVSPPQKIPIIEIDPPNVQLQPGDDGSTNMLSQRCKKMENSRPKSPSDLASSTASSSPAKAVKYTIY
ncbi:hypothetical protein BUALT_Bualt14G0052500 [Buddleja alternifolia]|uniref:Myb/SANT-like domain-containing protein n=1 Tax=Buddleja alternifolia TaxID=168488 RepID=A0AAV6WS60_9LAMI|nr:hypothetical protein BUALT_Bualt14G0052500 [Buddleja alternifolia]